jgi:Flp pilus assembly protein TadD
MKESWKLVGLGSAVIVLVTMAVYSPAMRGGFIWDDDDHLTNNPVMTASDGLYRIWSSLAASRYYPLTLTSFWVQRRLWGLNPLPYHVVNIALHGANAALVFVLLRRLGVSGAWVAAVLWALHPVCVESVAWVTELKNTQSALLFFLALLCYLRFEEQPGWGRYALALICAVGAMLSKPSTVVLPAVLLLMIWWERGRWRRSDWLRVGPLFVFSLGMSVLTVVEQHGHITRSGREAMLSGLERLQLVGKVVWFYLGKVVWPVDLMFIYPRWPLDVGSWLGWVPLVGAVAVGVVMWRVRERLWVRGCLFGMGYFVLMLVPVSGLFGIYFFRFSFVADHFQYLACVGPIALVVSVCAAVCKRVGQWGRYPGMVAAAVALAMLGESTWKQERVYTDLETLWRDTLAKNPGAWIAHNNLGMELFWAGNVEEATEHFEQALRIKPDYAEAHNNLGLALDNRGNSVEAAAEYQAALRIKPDYVEAHDNLGNALLRLGRMPEAIAEFAAAVRIKPDAAEPHYNMGNALLQSGRVSEAIAEYVAGLRIKPDYAEAHSNLGNALLRLGKVPEAIAEFTAAVRIKPDDAEAHNNLGVALVRRGRISEAVAEYREALRLRPDWPPALANLAWILATDKDANLRNAGEAVQLAERLGAVMGNRQAGVLDILAAAYAEAGRFSDAVQAAQKAFDLAVAAGHQEKAQQIQGRLKLYQAGQPYHED